MTTPPRMRTRRIQFGESIQEYRRYLETEFPNHWIHRQRGRHRDYYELRFPRRLKHKVALSHERPDYYSYDTLADAKAARSALPDFWYNRYAPILIHDYIDWNERLALVNFPPAPTPEPLKTYLHLYRTWLDQANPWHCIHVRVDPKRKTNFVRLQIKRKNIGVNIYETFACTGTRAHYQALQMAVRQRDTLPDELICSTHDGVVSLPYVNKQEPNDTYRHARYITSIPRRFSSTGKTYTKNFNTKYYPTNAHCQADAVRYLFDKLAIPYPDDVFPTH